MVIASVNQNDIRIASLQGASRSDPGKSGADDHDLLSTDAKPVGGGRHDFAGQRLSNFRGSRPDLLRRVAHCSPPGLLVNNVGLVIKIKRLASDC